MRRRADPDDRVGHVALWSGESRCRPSQQLGAWNRTLSWLPGRAVRRDVPLPGQVTALEALDRAGVVPELVERRGRAADDVPQTRRERPDAAPVEHAALVVDDLAVDRLHGGVAVVAASASSTPDLSPGVMQAVPPACSDARVVVALVVVLPMNVCECEAPGRPGKTIGSSGRLVRLTAQFAWNSWWVVGGLVAGGVAVDGTTPVTGGSAMTQPGPSVAGGVPIDCRRP